MFKYFASIASVVLGMLVLPSEGSSPGPAGVVFVTSDGPTHTVKYGETLWGITKRYGARYADVVRLNNIPPGKSVLQVGQKLKLPGRKAAARKPVTSSKKPSGYTPYKVRSGETLFAIARRHGLTMNAILAANPLRDSKLLQVGQTLKIPRFGSRSKPTPVVKSPPKPKPKVQTKKPVQTRRSAATPRGRGTTPEGFAHYVAQPGDTAVSIAKRYRLSKEALLRINGRSSNPNYTPRPGELVMVPTGGGWYQQKASSRQPVAQRATRRVAPTPQPRRTTNPAKRIWAQHTVAPNDTLEALARHFQVTVDQIRLDNPGIRSNRDLRVGSDLKIRIGSL